MRPRTYTIPLEKGEKFWVWLCAILSSFGLHLFWACVGIAVTIILAYGVAIAYAWILIGIGAAFGAIGRLFRS